MKRANWGKSSVSLKTAKINEYVADYIKTRNESADLDKQLTEDSEEVIALRKSLGASMIGAAIVLGDNSSTNANGKSVKQGYSEASCHVWARGNVIIRSDSFMSIARNHSLDACGYDVIIGTPGVNLHQMNKLASSATYFVPVYGGVLNFTAAGDPNRKVTQVRTLRVGSLQTHMGGYVNDLKTFIVDPVASKDTKKHDNAAVTHYATSDIDMDVRNNGNENGYILTDLGGNEIEIFKGDFSLDTQATSFNMSSGATDASAFNYDKMNTGDYGYLKSLTIGSSGKSVAKALLNDIDVINGITIHAGSELNMDGYKLRASAITGKVTNAASFGVGDFTYTLSTKNTAGDFVTPSHEVADYEGTDVTSHDGQKATAIFFEVNSFDAEVQAYVTKGNGAGRMDVDSVVTNTTTDPDTGATTNTYAYTITRVESGASLFVEKGAFTLGNSEGLANISIGAGSALTLAEGQPLTLRDGQGISIAAGGSLVGDITSGEGSSVSLAGCGTDGYCPCRRQAGAGWHRPLLLQREQGFQRFCSIA